ncbi:unnamed protein product [Spodoptera littoralis]|uniref:Serpin domain-containing protein n=1 Tax=Spodoptera littoralis TaxID=7109 RepID=A0A9P0N909_SPOLI|nr:unnamed protein product [Spodoptera littoralis]CAH1644196.1 unnamed protein product [Spodoptera littoralis]
MGENGSAAAGAAAAAAASSTTIIKTEHHVRKCAVNERYSKCPEKLCQPQVCEEVGIPQCSNHFDKTGPCPGPPACICVEGFVRNDEGVCMPAKECPSCGNDKNATAGCGVNCGRRCSNYMLSNVICADVCYSNNCDCKEDYVFDDYLGFCVLPQDCSNKNAPEPEGTDGTPGNEDGNESTDPCDDCSENNCDNTNENTDDIEETDCNGMDGETTTESEMNSSSTTESNEGSDSTTEGSGMTTEGSVMSYTTRRPRTTTKRRSRTTTKSIGGSEMTTEGSAIRSTTRRPRTTTKRRSRTTTESDGGSDMTTKGSGISSTTGKNKIKTESNMTTEDSGNGSTTEETETNMTTEESENGSTTEDSENGTTTEDSENGTTTEEMDTGMTTEESETGSTTEETEGDMTTKDSESGLTTEEMETGMTTEGSGNEGTTEQSSGSQRTTTKAPISTTRRTRKPRTTTKRARTTTKRRTTSSAPETTMKSTTRRPRRTTTKSASETTTMMTTTEASTTKGPKDCKGRNEWYFDCAPSCPQRTCEDYLNGVRCQASDRTSGCKPECRCMIGFYKDAEGNCVSTLQCRQSSSNSMTSTTTTSTTAEPTCEEEAIPLFAVGSLRYTLRILYEISLSNPGNSVMVGGASVLYLMGELALYSKGRAKTELLNVFNLQETEQISCAFPRISAALTAQYPDIEFSLFCKIYADNDCAMTDDFIQNTEKIFAIAPQNLDFSASDAARTISDEVEIMTNGNFENYLKTRTISTLDHLVMVDAEGFQAGVTRIFSNTSLGLENVASCEMPYVSEILQKITFHVDEYGMGETRDVEFAPIATTPAPRRQQTYRFKADHPFVYSLFHKEVMLQAGIFAGN